MMIACFVGYQDYFLPDAGSEHGAEYDNLLVTYYCSNHDCTSS